MLSIEDTIGTYLRSMVNEAAEVKPSVHTFHCTQTYYAAHEKLCSTIFGHLVPDRKITSCFRDEERDSLILE